MAKARAGVTGKRRKSFALVAGRDSRRFVFTKNIKMAGNYPRLWVTRTEVSVKMVPSMRYRWARISGMSER